MKYTCVDSKVEKTKSGREFACFWFQLDPNNKFEVPEKLKSFAPIVVESVKCGNQMLYEIEAEIVMYPLGRKMKFPNGIIVDQLRLFCPKIPIYEAVFDEHENPIIEKDGTPKKRFVKWNWMTGYSPEEQAINAMHILIPV